MPLHIECENGHKLVCPDSLAGSSVICPQCGSRVDVSARNLAKGGRAFSESAKASISGIQKGGTATAQAVATAPPLDEIAFSCPNGHRLSGPRSLQGRAGECPKCGVKFRVPIPTDNASSAAPSSEDEDISLDGIEEIDLAPPALPQPEARHGLHLLASRESLSDSPLRQLFAALWEERTHGGVFEIHLDSGVTIAPDWWSQRSSTDDYGVFARETDGIYEIHAIAWQHVRRISVRGLTELPGNVFDV